MRLSRILSDWRQMNRLAVREVAKRAGVVASTYWRIERGMDADGKSIRKVIAYVLADANCEDETARQK